MITALLISLIAAIVPTFLYALLFYWADRYEREPLWLLAIAFMWGGLPAVIMSFLGEWLIGTPFVHTPNSAMAMLVEGSIVVPIVEETVKAMALLGIFIWAYEEFDNALDGLVYGALIGFGFAMTENFLYFIGAFSGGGFTELSTVIFLRSILFGMNHALYTSIVGVGFGLVRNRTDRLGRLLIPFVALLIAIVIHSLHNLGVALTAVNPLNIIFSIILAACGLILLLAAIGITWQQERELLQIELADEVGETLTEAEYMTLTRNWSRPLRRRNEAERQQVRRMHLYVELALHKRRLSHLGIEREPMLDEQIALIREKLLV